MSHLLKKPFGAPSVRFADTNVLLSRERRVAKLLRARLRASDLVARMGGDDFAVLLPETGETAARTVLDQIRLGTAPAHHRPEIVIWADSRRALLGRAWHGRRRNP